MDQPRPTSYERPLAWTLWLVLGGAVLLAVYWVRAALLPFFLAFVIAYVFAPWVDMLERRARLPRPLGTAAVFLLLGLIGTLLMVGLMPVVERQVVQLLEKLPAALARIKEQGLPFLSQLAGDTAVPETARAWLDTLADSLKGLAPTLFQKTTGALMWAAAGTLQAVVWILSAAIIPVLVFYLMMDFRQVTPWLRARIPLTPRTLLDARLPRIDRMLGEFLRGQLLVGVILSVLYAVGLSVAGVDAAVAIGIIAGLGNMVPYLGFVIGITLSLLISLVTHFDLLHLVYVVIVFGVVQLLEGFVISPKVVGDRVGLHPVAIIFALFVGGEAFGFVGILLGVPAAICIKAFLEPLPSPVDTGNGTEPPVGC
ncbi:MAG: AI-2E family transporter [Nitrospirota bacterium]|nr:AI-2E family transporter [Nitrospirota bacterium]